VVCDVGDIDVVADCAVVQVGVANAGRFGYAAEECYSLVESAEFDIAGKRGIFDCIRHEICRNLNFLPVAACAVLAFKLLDLLLCQWFMFCRHSISPDSIHFGKDIL
jgi:hypothetical protein